jgi:pteridine reductase
MTKTQPPTAEKRVALVTGAGRRVGNGIARYLAAQGYRVALHANASLAAAEQTARELTAAGGEAIAVAADLADQAATRAMIAQVHQHFGRLDALVNNAAIWISKPLEAVTPDDLRRHFEINTLGTFVCSQQAGLVMAAQADGGAIVNVGDWAIERPYRDYVAYFAAKGSIPTLTRALAVELGLRNPRVRVNAVLPGPVLLPEGLSAQERKAIVSATLAGREGTVDELARAILFLLENSFVTGVCLPVDGGRSIYAPEHGP